MHLAMLLIQYTNLSWDQRFDYCKGGDDMGEQPRLDLLDFDA